MDVAQGLREHLIHARGRGLAFDDAWADALERALRMERDPFEQRAWAKALAGTRSTWQRAFDLEPASAWELAVSALFDPEREPLEGDDAEGAGIDGCPRCGGVIPATRGKLALFCSRACAQRASYERRLERLAA